MELDKDIHELIETLKQQRDELKVRAHLLTMEAKDEWEKAERKWGKFKSASGRMGTATKEAMEDITPVLKTLGKELKHAYEHIRKSI